jgi:hypothetical protein
MWRTCIVRSSPHFATASIKLLEPHLARRSSCRYRAARAVKMKKKSSNNGGDSPRRLPKSCGNFSANIERLIFGFIDAFCIIRSREIEYLIVVVLDASKKCSLP